VVVKIIFTDNYANALIFLILNINHF
jgi:hypothetical protein